MACRTSSKAASIISFCRRLEPVATFLILLHINPCSYYVYGAIRVNEIMLNPLNPAHGQWIELRSTENAPFVLTNYVLYAGTPTLDVEYRFSFQNPISIPANGYLTIGQNNNSG
jgi:hypothetical protein